MTGAVLVLVLVKLVELKNRFPILPLGSLFVGFQFLWTQLVRTLLMFGMRNNLAIVNTCHITNALLRVTGIAFNLLDCLLAEQRWL